MGQPRILGTAGLILALAALAPALSGCAGESEPVAAPSPSRPIEPATSKAPGTPTLGDVVDEVQSRRRVIEQLEEIEKDEP